MNPKTSNFYIAFTPADRTIWGIGKNNEDEAKRDCLKYLSEYQSLYPRELRNAKVQVVKASKKLYDLICQYGSYDKRFKMVNGIAEYIK